MRLYGINGSFTELSAPLIAYGWGGMVAEALVATLREQRRMFHWCILPGLLEGTPFEQWFAQRAEEAGWSWQPPVLDYVVPLAESWDAFRGGLKRNIKESLRHCYNSLKREGHELGFEAIDDPALLPEVLDEFLRLHAVRATMDDGPAHPDHYATPQRRQFLRELAAELMPQGRLLVCRLRINGDVVASRIAMVAGDSLYLYYSGYDPAWSRYSVMTTLTAEMIKLAIARGLRSVNFSTGTDVSKTRWGPETLTFRNLRIDSPSLEAKIVKNLIAASERALPVLSTFRFPRVKPSIRN
jgi:CelD/BcsL family acetyltransferase involved in cellulose biosynthesis